MGYESLWMPCSNYFYFFIYIDTGEATVQLFYGALSADQAVLFFFNHPSCSSQLYRAAVQTLRNFYGTLCDDQAVQLEDFI